MERGLPVGPNLSAETSGPTEALGIGGTAGAATGSGGLTGSGALTGTGSAARAGSGGVTGTGSGTLTGSGAFTTAGGLKDSAAVPTPKDGAGASSALSPAADPIHSTAPAAWA